MKIASFFFITLTISTFCWNGVFGLMYYKDTTPELIDFANGKLNYTCFRATATILENLFDNDKLELDFDWSFLFFVSQRYVSKNFQKELHKSFLCETTFDHDIKENHFYKLDEGDCVSHYKDGVQLTHYARKHFHNTNDVLENLQSCRDFVERAQRQESIYETMENIKNNKKGQDNQCTYNVKVFHDELRNYFSNLLRQLRYVEKGKYVDIAFEKLFYGIQWIKLYM